MTDLPVENTVYIETFSVQTSMVRSRLHLIYRELGTLFADLI